jgi:hypothetical protein
MYYEDGDAFAEVDREETGNDTKELAITSTSTSLSCNGHVRRQRGRRRRRKFQRHFRDAKAHSDIGRLTFMPRAIMVDATARVPGSTPQRASKNKSHDGPGLPRSIVSRQTFVASAGAASLARLLNLDEAAGMNVVDVTVNGNFPGNERMLANAAHIINYA